MTKSAAHDVQEIQTGIFILHGVGRSQSMTEESLMKNPKFPRTSVILKTFIFSPCHLLIIESDS
ncbi:hypothetical protein [Anabaena sp. AL93]|uniref:hypothetical protein n=1 Tax=Anabaena sp. AL93 TaxID=1678133 RepID=UPI0025C66B13|nr:hypothetical protein [Anabaena sp. AL93]